MDFGIYVPVFRDDRQRYFLAADPQPTQEMAEQLPAAQRGGARVVPIDHQTVQPSFTKEEICARWKSYQLLYEVVVTPTRLESIGAG